MAAPTIQELQDPARFKLLYQLRHEELTAFAVEYYRHKKSAVTAAHSAFCLLTGIAWALVGFLQHHPLGAWLMTLGNSVWISLLLVLPFHEWIHGLACQMFGARRVSYRASWRKLYVCAVAHHLVLGARAFAWVALAPFLIITFLLVGATFWFTGWQFFLLAVLMIHTAGTSGDFALLNFLWWHRGAEVYNYDDAINQVTYFYQAR